MLQRLAVQYVKRRAFQSYCVTQNHLNLRDFLTKR